MPIHRQLHECAVSKRTRRSHRAAPRLEPLKRSEIILRDVFATAGIWTTPMKRRVMLNSYHIERVDRPVALPRSLPSFD